jgi:hypothetical protein
MAMLHTAVMQDRVRTCKGNERVVG